MPVKITSAGLFVLPGRNKTRPEHAFSTEDLAALPAAPGVYLFRDSRRRPIYIGKSVNIRSRVAAHLRNGDEAQMLLESASIDFIETAGEIGALLQESQLIKRWQPRYNRMLVWPEQPWVLAGARGALALAAMRSSDAALDGLRTYGAYASRSAAEAALQQLVRRSRLCPALTGLEAKHSGRGCFARQLGQCGGACVGHEPIAAYRRRRSRALAALQASVWPFAGAIGIVEERAGLERVHVIDGWSYRGMLASLQGTPPLRKGGFDPDVYRIVAAPLMRGDLRVEGIQLLGSDSI